MRIGRETKRMKQGKLSAAAKREQNWGWFMVGPTIIEELAMLWASSVPKNFRTSRAISRRLP